MTARTETFVALQLLCVLIAAPAGLALLFASPSDGTQVYDLVAIAIGASLASMWFARCAIRSA